jgi:ATP synthase F1 delta subunit
MAEKIAVKRYAEAFLAYAKDTCGQEKLIRDLHELKVKVISKNPEFLEVLHNPGIAFHEKCDFIDRVLNEDFSQEIRHFLKLLLEKGRINQFLDIMEYIRASYSQTHVEDAVLKTTFPLSLEFHYGLNII